MSQKKVDAYKDYKKNKEKYIKKEKRSRRLELLAALLVCAVIAVWIGFSAVSSIKRAEAENPTIEPVTLINATDYQEYISELELNY